MATTNVKLRQLRGEGASSNHTIRYDGTDWTPSSVLQVGGTNSVGINGSPNSSIGLVSVADVGSGQTSAIRAQTSALTGSGYAAFNSLIHSTTGSATVYALDASITTSSSTGTHGIRVQGGNSNALLALTNNSSSTDSLITLVTGSSNWALGNDSSASGAFKIANSTGLGTSDRLSISTGGQITLPNYTTTTSFTGTVVGGIAFTSSGNLITTTPPITTFNGSTGASHSLATGTSGTDFNISTIGALHTLNIPSASASNRGLITTGTQTIAGDKTFTGSDAFTGGSLTLGVANTSRTDLVLSTTNTGSVTLRPSNSTTTNYTLTLPTTDGSSNQVLTTDGSGVLSWADPGTVTTVSVASANGFAGSVANATTTPAITLSTSITGVIKGNGTALQQAVLGTDYVGGGTASTGQIPIYSSATNIEGLSLDRIHVNTSNGRINLGASSTVRALNIAPFKWTIPATTLVSDNGAGWRNELAVAYGGIQNFATQQILTPGSSRLTLQSNYGTYLDGSLNVRNPEVGDFPFEFRVYVTRGVNSPYDPYDDGSAYSVFKSFVTGVDGTTKHVDMDTAFYTRKSTDASNITGGGNEVIRLKANQDIQLTAYPNSRDDSGTAVNFLSTDASGNLISNPVSSLSGGTPAGSDTQIQFNNAGAFGASTNLEWVDASTRLDIGSPASPGASRVVIKGADNSATGFALQTFNSSDVERTRITNTGVMQASGLSRLAFDMASFYDATARLRQPFDTNFTGTSGTTDLFHQYSTFAPTSGTAVFNGIYINQQINQTGGANGITRGIFIDPALTAASDFRALETTVGKVIFGGTNAIQIPIGTTAQRVDTQGNIRYNTTATQFEGYNGSSWVAFGGGGISDGDKGDITVSGSGATWTIDNDAVTFAKMQNITSDRLLGRDTSSSGDIEEISVSGGLEWTGSGGIQRSALTGDVTASAGSNSTTIANNAVTTAKINDGAVTNAKVTSIDLSKLTSATLVSGLVATVPSSSSFRFNYNGGNPAIVVSTSANESSLFSQDGEQFVSVNNTSTLIGSGTQYAEYINGALRLYDSDLTNYVAIQPPATGTLTSSYTLTLPADDGTSNQVLTTNGSGTLSWTTPSGGGGSPSVVSFSEFTSDQDNITTSGLSSATVVRVSGDDGIRTITSISSTGMSDGWAFKMVNVGSQPLILAAQHPSASSNNGFLIDKDVLLPAKHFINLIWDSTSGGFMVSPGTVNESGKIFSIYTTPTSASTGDNSQITYALTSGTVTGLAATTASSGSWQASTGTGMYNAAGISMGKSGSLGLGLFGKSYIYYESIVSIPTLSDGTNTFFVTHLLRNNIGVVASNNPSQGVQIAYSHGENSGKWFATTRGSGSTTTVDLGVTVTAGTVYHLLIAVNKQGTEARFYIDGVYRGRSTAEFPTTNTILFGTTGIGKTAGTTARTALIHKLGLTHIYAN